MRRFRTLTNLPSSLAPSFAMDSFRRPPQRESWFAPLSVDLILKVLYVTFLHPFVAWMVPLCFRAETMEYTAMPMKVSIVYASLVTACWILSAINKRIAFGRPRYVDLEDEVIVITGGASGLGLLIAEVYGMRGASVAVLDVREMENGEARGVTYYKCDVADKAQVARVAAEIERDVGFARARMRCVRRLTDDRLGRPPC